MKQLNEEERAAFLQQMTEDRMERSPFIRRQDDVVKRARCPQCNNTQNFKTGGPSPRGRKHYDIYSDTQGRMRCPVCGYRAHVAAFHQD